MPTARLSRKSQIVIPAAIRRRLGLQPGDLLELHQEGEHIVIRKAPRSALEELERVGGVLWRDYAEELKRAREEWED